MTAAVAKGPNSRFILIGQRCIAECALQGLTPVWSADTVAHRAEVPALTSRIADAPFAQIGANAADEVGLIYVDPDSGEITERSLMPFDFAQVPHVTGREPLITLPPQDVMASLVTEMVCSSVCEGLKTGFAAEKNARLAAMTRARSNIRQTRDDLTGEFAPCRN